MTQGVQRRFYKAMTSYCSGALEHVDRESHARVPSIEEQLATRRRSSGVTPLFALVEYEDLPFASHFQTINSFRHLGTPVNLICRTRYSSIRP